MNINTPVNKPWLFPRSPSSVLPSPELRDTFGRIWSQLRLKDILSLELKQIRNIESPLAPSSPPVPPWGLPDRHIIGRDV